MKKFVVSVSICSLSVAMSSAVYAAGDANVRLGEMTVTATREAQSVAETAVSVGVIDQSVVDEVKPAHPSEIMERVPGVHVNVTGGEGHMTAIRQPITTGAVYLYLEDGIPTRSTGFFNHNALYEVNLPQAGGIEVLKGPGTALYGSDAIGAVINVQTRPAPLQAETTLDLEAGGHGWARMLVSTGNSWGDDGLRADLNLTRTDGWRDATDYDRQTGTLRWDRILNSGATLKTVLTGSRIDQQTAGSSRLLADDYYNNPEINYTPISYRKVDALRVSMAYEKETADSLLSVTPYLRANSMDMLPNWMLSYDPVVYETANDSFGLLLKYRQDFAPYRTRVIVGVDVDHSPGSRYEQDISATKEGNIYTRYTVNSVIYDYDVTYQGLSPYIHTETSPTDRLRLSLGLRYDDMSYDYDNKLTALDTGSHRRPADTRVDFSRLSPKLGLTYAMSPSLNSFLSYREAFRAPSERQLFRQGQSLNTTALKPVKVKNYELGLRGKMQTTHYSLSLYYMSKKDDILTFENADGNRETGNAGETLHQGLEIGFGASFTKALELDVAASYAKHTYEDWVSRVGDFSGNEMAMAPRLIANTRLAYRPEFMNRGKLELEWVKLGDYWMDEANSYKYPGHDVINLRANYPLNKKLGLYARLMNVADKRYATTAKYTAARYGRPEKFEYAPGMPRTFYAGLNYRF